MSNLEFDDFIDYLKSLWPKYAPTGAQLAVWWESFRKPDHQRARRCAAELFKRTKWPEPRLNEILDLLRKERGQDSGDADFTPEHIAQCQAEASSDAALLADWTEQEFIDGKAEIIAHEPGMALFDAFPANGRFWKHFFVERYVHHRATIFGSGIMTQNGRHVRSPTAIPQQIPRDEYWKAGPQPRRTGIKSVPDLRNDKIAAQAAKVEFIQGENP